MRAGAVLSWVAVALAAAGGGAWLWTRPIEVPVVEAVRGAAAEVVYATGVVEPENWAAVAPVGRGRIMEVCACEGAVVEAGAPLIRLDDAATQAQMRELEARLDFAEKTLARMESLLERRVVSYDAYDGAQALVAELRAGRARVEAALEELVLRSPLDGVVLRMDAEMGETAEPGRPLAWVGRTAPLLVRAEVNEEDIPRVAVGQRALVKADAFPGRALQATVAAITPMGDPELRTWRVELSLPADTPLMVGMTVEANLIAREVAEALLIPSGALVDGAVWRLAEDGRLARREVEVGLAGAERVQVLSGLAEGDLVVSPVPEGLREGAAARASGRR